MADRSIEEFKKKTYDLLVIGGGINGAAIAHLAGRQGLVTALLEKGDFSSGTSSRSTKLIHGGIRYLENLEFDLVSESLYERYLQLEAAPHLVRPLEFVIPVYRGDARPLWMMRLGVFLYDLLAGSKKIGTHRKLSPQEVLELEPGLKREGLTGGVTYFDAQMDDARLCLENVLSAREHGADVANYVKVTSYLKENGKVVGVKARDVLSGQTFEVRAKKVICTVGPWTNELIRWDHPQAKKRVRTTKGIHLVYEGRISKKALLVTSKKDNRVFFIIPWMGNSLIGTTDTNYIGDPDKVAADREDIDYLVTEAKRFFPGWEFQKEKVVTVFAGLRPLIRRGGSPTKVSRKHLFYETTSGLVFVVGGKYTTYRKVAEDCLKKICPGYHKTDFTLYGSGVFKESCADVSQKQGLDEEIIQSLRDRYGIRSEDILKLAGGDSALKKKVLERFPVILAEIVYGVKYEFARTAEDIVSRRLSFSYQKLSDAEKEILGRNIEQVLEQP
ncbi:MAG: glycerol-3-phosphate dehydrogenase [Candidatus Omnitrophica bacterium]|nr:glycerol-3-phosphate dehydrogenase [Candidatus Omnitrophota bacterium]